MRNKAVPNLLLFLDAGSVICLFGVERCELLLNLLCQTVDECGPFLLLIDQQLGFLLVGILVVIESVFDGEDVLVYGNTIFKELCEGECTFYS